MGRRLRMTAELGDWLAELGDSQPETAAEAALVAVLGSAEPSGLAIVGQPGRSDRTDAGQPRAAQPPTPPPPAERRGPEPVPGLLELRADPLGSDIRILLAVEPPDTVTLLAVLEGHQAVSEHGARAVQLAGDLLTEIRDGGWPADIDKVLLADPDEFLARFFPANEGSIARRAGVLAAGSGPVAG